MSQHPPALTHTLEMASLKVSALLQDPIVEVAPDAEGGMAVLTIEEGGAIVQLEFVDEGCFQRFQARLAALDLGRAA